MQDGTSIGVLVAFLAGLLSFLSPCVLPLVPSYVSFVTGLGLEELEQGGGEVKRVTLVHSLLFVAGFTLIFLLMGASATYVGQLLRVYQDTIARIGGVIIILFGILLLGVIPIPALSGEKRYQFQSKPVGYAGTVAVGVAFARRCGSRGGTPVRLLVGAGDPLCSQRGGPHGLPELVPEVSAIRPIRRVGGGDPAHFGGAAIGDRQVHNPGGLAHPVHARLPAGTHLS